MSKGKRDIAKLSNAFSTGGGGVNFERHVQAVFALALIIEGFSPIIDLPIQKLDFQGKHQNFDVDDLVVTASDSVSHAKLLCQIKHSVSITKNDPVFQEVINAAWSDFNKPIFNPSADKIALITGFIAKDSIFALRHIHEQSLAALDPASFISRIYKSNFTSKSVRDRFEVIKHCLTLANKNTSISDSDLWNFCRCFVLAIFDLDYEESVNRVLIHSLINCKTDRDAKQLWRSLADECGYWNQVAATITRDCIPTDILEAFGYQSPSSASASTLFSPNHTWAIVMLIGYWDENNECDISAVEQLAGTSYFQFQQECHNLLLSYPEFLTLQNGLWKVRNRKLALSIVRDLYFDGTIKKAFQIARKYLKEDSKQFSENGEFGIVIPSTGRFENSDGMRKGLLEGLCILANGPDLIHCADNLISTESHCLIRDTLENCNWVHLVSLSDVLLILAEMNPISYLRYLEDLIASNPAEIERLFPKKDSHPLIDGNFITTILFSLELLAWNEAYLVQCIRCLGELESLPYERTNWVNTPINTITTILSPFMPKTCASIEKQKNAIQALKVDHPNLCWKVITELLPNVGSFITTGSIHPQYMHIDIFNESKISNQDQNQLFEYYIHLAIQMAGTDIDRLAQLSEHTIYMLESDILSFLDSIQNSSQTWDDNSKCNVWIKLCELKYREIIDNDSIEPDTPQFKALCNTIEYICPQDIRYQHKRLYLSHFTEFLFDDSWEDLEVQKQTAIEEIYRTLGLKATIDFSISVNAVHEVGNQLGQKINKSDLLEILPEYEKGNNPNFFSSIVKAYLSKNGISIIKEIDLSTYNPTFIATILKDAPFSQALIDLIPKYLPGYEALFWETVQIPLYDYRHSDYNVKSVILTLLSHHRAPTAIRIIGHNIRRIDIDDSLIYKVLMQAPLDKDGEKIHHYSLQNLIKHLQNSSNPDINKLSNIEYIYLPLLDRHSHIQPRALNYRIANEPAYFCEIMEIAFKKHDGDCSQKELPQAMAERIFQIIFNFSIIPGTDWNGVFQSDIFISWINEVKHWAKENDRFEVTLQTIGNGLSYAKFNADGTLDHTIMRELNASDNDEMRKGYELGVFNQRGAHWVDPEGKPEKALAQKFSHRSEAVEALGYSRFSGLLQSIAFSYLAEAEENVRRHRSDDNSY